MGRQRRRLALALLAAATLLSQPETKKKMSIDFSSLKLPDSAFWTPGSRDPGRDPIPEKLLFSHFGVLIDAPSTARVNEQNSLPLFAYFLGSFRQIATRNFPHDAHIVAVDPAHNIIRVAPLAERKEGFPEGAASSPASEMPEGFAAVFHRADVREQTHLPWSSGRVISQVIMLDMESNRVETNLIAGASAFVDPEKERFLAEERAKQDPPAPLPSRRLEPAAGDPPPAIPDEPGIALSAPRVAVLDGVKPLPLSLSFRLPVFPEERVKPANTEINRTRHLIQADGATPFAACLAIHLVVSTSGEERPYVFTLQLPVATVKESVAAGAFTIDLRSLPQFPTADQTLVIRAYAKDWASATATIGIVDRQKK